MAAIVEGDRLVAGAGQGFDPAGVDPVDLAGGAEAMDQQDGLAGCETFALEWKVGMAAPGCGRGLAAAT
jgi:hypothetical protein